MAAVMAWFHCILAYLPNIHAWLILIISIIIEYFIVVCHFLASIRGTQHMALCLSYNF